MHKEVLISGALLLLRLSFKLLNGCKASRFARGLGSKNLRTKQSLYKYAQRKCVSYLVPKSTECYRDVNLLWCLTPSQSLKDHIRAVLL